MNPTRAAVSPAPERIDRFRGDHAFLSNFHRHPFRWRGKTWTTAEAPFQASKTRDERMRERIRAAASPAEAKRLGRRADLRSDWDRIKDDVMDSVLRAKFAVAELCDLKRAGRCDRAICHRRSGWRHVAGGTPSCIPLEILRRLERAEAPLPNATDR